MWDNFCSFLKTMTISSFFKREPASESYDEAIREFNPFSNSMSLKIFMALTLKK